MTVLTQYTDSICIVFNLRICTAVLNSTFNKSNESDYFLDVKITSVIFAFRKLSVSEPKLI